MSVVDYQASIPRSQSSRGPLTREQDDKEFEMQPLSKSHTTSGLLYAHCNGQLGWRHWTLPTLSLLAMTISGPVTSGLLYTFYILPEVNEQSFESTIIACDIDRLWSSWVTLFQVNIRSGYISFTAAKIIDVAWDTIVGRGGQFLLMWMSYRVHTDVMMYLAEHEAIDFKLFTTTMLYSDSLWTASTAIKSLFSNMSRRTRWMLVWMVLAISYVLGFPTILSASTSYVTATRPAALLVDNTTISVERYLESAAYSLTEHGIGSEPDPWYINVANISAVPRSFGNCNIMWRSPHSFTVGGLDLVVDGNSSLISNSTTIRCGFYIDQHFYDKTSVAGIGNATSLSLPNGQAICQPDGKSYQWGASFELLMILVILQCIWSIGMWTVWVISNRGSRLIRHKRKMGSLRAVLDIAKPLTDANIDDGMFLGHNELQQIVRRRGRIKYRIYDDDDDDDVIGRQPRVDVVEQD